MWDDVMDRAAPPSCLEMFSTPAQGDLHRLRIMHNSCFGPNSEGQKSSDKGEWLQTGREKVQMGY